MAAKKTQKRWEFTSPKPEKPTLSEAEKLRTETQCQAFIQRMKPIWVQPPNENWGYVSDVYGKWYRSYYYFCALYKYHSLDALQPEKEMKFTRLEYAGPDQFHMAYFRHTGQFWRYLPTLAWSRACRR